METEQNAVIASITAWAEDHKKPVNYDDGESLYVEVGDLVAFLNMVLIDGEDGAEEVDPWVQDELDRMDP